MPRNVTCHCRSRHERSFNSCAIGQPRTDLAATSCVNGIPVPGIKAGSAVPCRTSVLSHKQLARVWNTKPPTQPPTLPPTKRSTDDPARHGYLRISCFASSEVTASCNNRRLRISMPRRRHLDKTSLKRSVPQSSD